ncbi:hypothetical protein, partial [Desulfobulbus sp.]|uniref:hypothetical protein n=1 Tax=Desulfobulbus sp. TaxID=895 RepID=UPI0027B9CAA0
AFANASFAFAKTSLPLAGRAIHPPPLMGILYHFCFRNGIMNWLSIFLMSAKGRPPCCSCLTAKRC